MDLYERAKRAFKNKNKTVKGGASSRAKDSLKVGTHIDNKASLLGVRICKKKIKKNPN